MDSTNADAFDATGTDHRYFHSTNATYAYILDATLIRLGPCCRMCEPLLQTLDLTCNGGSLRTFERRVNYALGGLAGVLGDCPVHGRNRTQPRRDAYVYADATDATNSTDATDATLTQLTVFFSGTHE